MNRAVVSAIQALLCSMLVAACSAGWNPIPLQNVEFLDRAQSQQQQGVTVLAAVPGAREARTVFGADIYGRGVQPVWIEIDNRSDTDVTFLPFGLDAYYFSPLETASMRGMGKNREQVERYFFSSGIDPIVRAGESRSGFIFTHLDEGTKGFNVDIVRNGDSLHFTFFIPVPGLKLDHQQVDFENLYPADAFRQVDESTLISELRSMPCCTTDKAAAGAGDPLNLVIVGNPMDVYYAFIRAGWDETEVVDFASGLKTAASFLTGGEYRYSPVSSLYVFGRAQDVAFQKTRASIHERNHLRLWMTPLIFQGKTVWIGQISRDVGVRFTMKTITTHKIDPNVDETREFLLENLAYHQVLRKIAYVGGTGQAPPDAPRANLTGDPYFTDGFRGVFFVTGDPVSFDDIELLDWEWPPGVVIRRPRQEP